MSMSMMKKTIAVALLPTLLLTGCVAGAGPKQTGGTLIGGAAGGLLGAQFGKGTGRLFGTGIGALAGAFLGGAIGAEMDARDRELAMQSMQRTLEHAPDYKSSTWKNPNNNHHGRTTVTKTVETSKNTVCRDYESEVFIGTEKQKVVGRACRNVQDPKAQWTVVK